jgi:hypothetical protein
MLANHLPPASEPESGFAAQFLMKEYDALTHELARNEDRGEARLTMFLTLVAAVIGGLVTLAASNEEAAVKLVRPVASFAIIGMLAIGVIVFLRLLKRDELTDNLIADLSSLRAIIRERLDPTGLLNTWQPFKSLWSNSTYDGNSSTKPRRRSLGKLANMMAVVNSILAGALAIVLADGIFPEDAFGDDAALAALSLVAALATLGTHLLCERAWRRRPRPEAP